MPGRAADRDVAAEEQRALLHAEQAERLPARAARRPGCRRRCRPPRARPASRRASSSMSTRVAREWRATLVRISWKMRNIVVEMSMSNLALGRQLRAAADAGALLELLRLPADRGHQAHVVEHLGAQAGGDLAHRLHRGIDQRAHRVGLLDAARLSFRRLASQVTSIFRPVSTWPSSSWISRAMCARSSSRMRDQVGRQAAQLVLRLAQPLALAEQLHEHRDLGLEHLRAPPASSGSRPRRPRSRGTSRSSRRPRR